MRFTDYLVAFSILASFAAMIVGFSFGSPLSFIGGLLGWMAVLFIGMAGGFDGSEK